LQSTARILSEWGLVVELGDHALDRYGYLAGRDDDRLADLNDAYADPEVRAIFTTRGGKGSYRIAARLDFDAIAADPKPLIGFSDITALHAARLSRLDGPAGVHGPAANWTEPDSGAEAAAQLRRVLMTMELVTVSADRNSRTGQLTSGDRVSGRLIGGNLGALANAVGWSLPDLHGAILLLEDQRGTGLGQVDRQLTQLGQAGRLDQLAGVALGSFGELESEQAGGWQLSDLLGDHLHRLGVPVLGGLPIGHSPGAGSVPLGTMATIDPTRNTLTVDPLRRPVPSSGELRCRPGFIGKPDATTGSIRSVE
jgi:muramoyltetrapeptide carboxypeptidase